MTSSPSGRRRGPTKSLELGHHLGRERLEGAPRLVEGHVTGRELESDVLDEPGLEHRGEALGDLLDRAGTRGDRVLDVGEDGAQRRERLLAVLGRDDQTVVPVDVLCTPDEPFHAAAGDVVRLVLRWGDRHDHRGADARPAVRPVDAERVPLVLVPGLDVGVIGLLVDRAGPHQAHAVAARRGRVARVPERESGPGGASSRAGRSGSRGRRCPRSRSRRWRTRGR